MPRPSLSFYTFAPVLAAIFACAAIALALTSRPQVPVRLTELAVIEGRLRSRSAGVMGTTLAMATRSGERLVDAGACAPATGGLKAGDGLTVWTDTRGRAWRIMAAGRPVCTFLQATTADEASRRRRRITAFVLALAGAACIAATLVRQRRVRLIDEGSAA